MPYDDAGSIITESVQTKETEQRKGKQKKMVADQREPSNVGPLCSQQAVLTTPSWTVLCIFIVRGIKERITRTFLNYVHVDKHHSERNQNSGKQRYLSNSGIHCCCPSRLFAD